MKQSDSFAKAIGAKLKDARKLAGMSQEAVGGTLGLKGPVRHVYVGKLERGEVFSVSLRTVVRYLQACKAPVARFMVGLAQAGAFGEVEQMTGLEVKVQRAEASEKAEAERRERARVARRNRKHADAAIRAMLRAAVMEAVIPCLKEDWERRQVGVYANGVDLYYRAWKRIVRGAAGADPVPAINATFDELERLGISQRLNPAAVHKMREVIFKRLQETNPELF